MLLFLSGFILGVLAIPFALFLWGVMGDEAALRQQEANRQAAVKRLRVALWRACATPADPGASRYNRAK